MYFAAPVGAGVAFVDTVVRMAAVSDVDLWADSDPTSYGVEERASLDSESDHDRNYVGGLNRD